MHEEGYIRIQLGGTRWKSKPKIHGWAIIDAADAELTAIRWHWKKSGKGNGHAARYVALGDGRYRSERMSRVILGLEPGDPREADHINGHTLDNRRSNLRITTHAENLQNVSAHRDARSPYRGVDRPRPDVQWRARVSIAGRTYLVGRYDDELEAAQAASVFREQHMTHSVESRH